MDYQYQAVEQPSNPRKTWPIVLSVVVALTVACGAGSVRLPQQTAGGVGHMPAIACGIQLGP